MQVIAVKMNSPMVSGTLKTMSVKVELIVTSLKWKGTLIALLDSGYTRCLLSLNLVERLGIHLDKLKVPIAFT